MKNRGLFIFMTALFVSALNVVFNSGSSPFSTKEEYYISKVLAGPINQEDPLLLEWVRQNAHPPSSLTYNFNHELNGIDTEPDYDDVNKMYSPSQNFILSTVENLLGKEIENGGTFVEAGAYNGEFLSNTLSLEYEYGWKGILVEPHPTFFQELLSKNRKSWAINACLSIKPWPLQELFLSRYGDKSTHHLANGINANPSIEKDINLASSGLAKFSSPQVKVDERFLVQCLPIYTILKALDMTNIDFLSLDVEGAEMEILDTIPWNKVSFSILAIEHNELKDLREYLRPKGYIHVESLQQDHIFVNKRRNFSLKDPAPFQRKSPGTDSASQMSYGSPHGEWVASRKEIKPGHTRKRNLNGRRNRGMKA